MTYVLLVFISHPFFTIDLLENQESLALRRKHLSSLAGVEDFCCNGRFHVPYIFLTFLFQLFLAIQSKNNEKVKYNADS